MTLSIPGYNPVLTVPSRRHSPVSPQNQPLSFGVDAYTPSTKAVQARLTAPVHFGAKERPRLSRPANQSDELIKQRILEDLKLGKINWKGALYSSSDESIGLGLKYRLAKSQSDPAAKDVVYIGRNVEFGPVEKASMYKKYLEHHEKNKRLTESELKQKFELKKAEGKLEGDTNMSDEALYTRFLETHERNKNLTKEELQAEFEKAFESYQKAHSIINDMDLQGFGNVVSRHHGNISLDENKHYVYTDEHSFNGTRVVIEIPTGQARTVHGNTALVIPAQNRWAEPQFLTLLAEIPDSETKPLPQELVLDRDTATANRDFSQMVKALKPSEALYVAQVKDKDKFGLDVTKLKVSRHAVTDPVPETSLYRITSDKEDHYTIQNLGENQNQVIQFLNPIVKKPAQVVVRPGDKITFPTNNSYGYDFHMKVPEPIENLDLDAIKKAIEQDGRIDTSRDYSTTITADGWARDQVKKKNRDNLKQLLQQ